MVGMSTLLGLGAGAHQQLDKTSKRTDDGFAGPKMSVSFAVFVQVFLFSRRLFFFYVNKGGPFLHLEIGGEGPQASHPVRV